MSRMTSLTTVLFRHFLLVDRFHSIQGIRNHPHLLQFSRDQAHIEERAQAQTGRQAQAVAKAIAAKSQPKLQVDVITTMLDKTFPLTTGEYDEWGNPNSKDYYDYMLSYSPYDNVEAKVYPNMLVTAGYHDSQVQYWEPLKYVAKMREYKTDNNPFLFDCNMDAGHGGGSGLSNERKETAKFSRKTIKVGQCRGMAI